MAAIQQLLASYHAAAGGFSPTDIAGLNLWLPADQIVATDGDPLDDWKDRSGNAYDYTQSTSGDRPTYKANIVNGNPVVRFNGTNQYFTGPNHLTGLTAATILIVMKSDNDPPVVGDGGLWRLGSDTSSGSANHVPYTDGVIYDGAGSNTRYTVGDPTPSLAAWRAYSIVTSSSEWTARLDNSTLYTTGSNTVGWRTAPLLGKTTNNLGYSGFFDGDIAELLIYDSALGSTDRASLQTYFAAKYGL